MKATYFNEKGFSLTELMFAMTILAIGLLAMAQMQIMAMRGTATSRDFSIATNLAKDGMETVKVTGLYMVEESAIQNTVYLYADEVRDNNSTNNADADHMPEITPDTDILSDLSYDFIEIIGQNATSICGKIYGFSATCEAYITADDWEFIRLYNVRNLPDGGLQGSIMKDVNVIVLWKDGTIMRSVNIRTRIARKDLAFF